MTIAADSQSRRLMAGGRSTLVGGGRLGFSLLSSGLPGWLLDLKLTSGKLLSRHCDAVTLLLLPRIFPPRSLT